MREERRRAVGLASPLPSISGAEPWTASKIEASLPMFPDGVKPNPPIRPADKSERMSPYLSLASNTVDVGSSQIGHDHDSLGVWCGVGSDSQTDSVEEILGVFDVGVVFGDGSASSQEHSIREFPTCQRGLV